MDMNAKNESSLTESSETTEVSDTNLQESEENDPAPSRKKWLAPILTAVGCLILLLCGGCFANSFMTRVTLPVTVEVEESPELERQYDADPLNFLYRVEPARIDLAVPGDYPVSYRFFGFLKRDRMVQVCDTTKPELSLRNVYIIEGTEVSCRDFVLQCRDNTGASYEFSGNPPQVQTAGEYEVTVRAADAYGNASEQTATLFIQDSSAILSIDLNTSDLEEHMKQIFPEITKVDLDNVDTDTFGVYALRACSDTNLYLWKVNVTDTTPPEAKTQNLRIRATETLDAEDFISEITDVSPCTVSYDTEPDYERLGFQPVSLWVEDRFGNRTNVSAKLLISDFPETLTLEYGSDMQEVTDVLFGNMQNIPHYFQLTGGEPELSVGSRNLKYQTIFGDYDIELNVTDTTAPVLELRDLAFYLGEESVVLDDFIVSCEDLSAVSCSYEKEPPLDNPGKHTVTVIASDEYGNQTRSTAQLEILTDTTPPVIYGVKNLKITEGDPVSYLDGVYAVDDRSGNVSVKADDSAANTSVAGTYPIRYSSTDASGNTAEATATLTVIADMVPPVIYGAHDITIIEGETVSFRKGVYAIDDRSGDTAVTVDSSAANPYAAGTYPIHYSSTDASGNTATVTVYLIVKTLSLETVYSQADQILSQILWPSMSQYEKAWAVYRWCTGNLYYSTRTSHLMGQFVNGAYSGLTTRSGNCYIYYAAASALLTRAGIENIEIQRNDPANPHYWNLVNIDGSWYHFDTCPHYAGHELQCFLLTDAEVKAYSDYEVANYYSFDSGLYPATP